MRNRPMIALSLSLVRHQSQGKGDNRSIVTQPIFTSPLPLFPSQFPLRSTHSLCRIAGRDNCLTSLTSPNTEKKIQLENATLPPLPLPAIRAQASLSSTASSMTIRQALYQRLSTHHMRSPDERDARCTTYILPSFLGDTAFAQLPRHVMYAMPCPATARLSIYRICRGW